MTRRVIATHSPWGAVFRWWVCGGNEGPGDEELSFGPSGSIISHWAPNGLLLDSSALSLHGAARVFY